MPDDMTLAEQMEEALTILDHDAYDFGEMVDIMHRPFVWFRTSSDVPVTYQPALWLMRLTPKGQVHRA